MGMVIFYHCVTSRLRVPLSLLLKASEQHILGRAFLLAILSIRDDGSGVPWALCS
jgi:hypothetical protein